MRQPAVYTATEIKYWPELHTNSLGNWVPDRPKTIYGLYWFLSGFSNRLKLAWKVFIGEYDALSWNDK